MGNGYTRQSAASIVDTAVIEAADHNAEFNAIESAFNASTGHSHDGTLGEGPKINLTTSVTGVLPVANGGVGSGTKQGILDNLFDGTTHVDDDKLRIANEADNTKLLKFNIASYSTATTRTVTLPNSNITISPYMVTILDDADEGTFKATVNLEPGVDIQAYDADLSAISALASTGFAVRSASNTWVQRIVEGTSGQVTVTNGSGISGNPTIALASSPTVSGTMTAGTFSGSGASLTALNATNLTTGTVPSARVSGTYSTLTGTGALNSGSIASGFGNINIGSSTFTGNGGGLTSLNANNISTGTLDPNRLPSAIGGSRFFDDVFLQGSSSVLHVGYLGGNTSTYIAFYGAGDSVRTAYIQGHSNGTLVLASDLGAALTLSTNGVASLDGATLATSSNYTSLGITPQSRTISTGTGLTGGGDLSANRTLSVSSDVWRDGNTPSAAQLDTVAGGTIATVYTGSTQNQLDFPIGHIVLAFKNSTARPRNSSVTVYLHNVNSAEYTTRSSDSAGTLAGTWRARGEETGAEWVLLQRTA